MPAETIKSYLDSQKVKYVVISHSQAYTAQEIAQSAHIPGRALAKTVIVKVDGKMVMVVEPANQKVNLEALKQTIGGKEVSIANEYEFQDKFEGCELGAMPPFGHLYDMVVYVASALTKGGEIAFNAGSHKELIRMAYRDFEALVKPTVI